MTKNNRKSKEQNATAKLRLESVGQHWEEGGGKTTRRKEYRKEWRVRADRKNKFEIMKKVWPIGQ